MEKKEKTGFSFGFKARTETGPLKTKSAINEAKEDKEETDFIKAVDGSDIKSVKEAPKKAGPLVIPLIQKNKWRVGDKSKSKDEASSKQSEKDDSANAAAKELIEAARRRENDEEEEGQESTLEIPLLMQNQIPEGFETDEKMNTDLRPEESTLEDYEQVPIEHFGMALLRGMGWKEGEGIGKNKKDIKPIEAQLRPKGMGLGADKSALLQDKNKNSKKRPTRPGDEKEEQPLEIKKGVHCVLLKKPYEDLYATIQGVDDDNNRCMVKLSLSGEIVSVSSFSVKLVDKKDFDKYSRYLNKGKSDRYKDKEKSQNGSDSPSDQKRRKYDTENRDSPSDNKNSRQTSSSKHSSKKPSEGKVNKRWVRPHLKVKIIDRHFKDGKYYSSKVIVDDVLPGSVVCKTDSGRLLEGLREDQLETVIPRENNSHVMIVSGKHSNQIGQLIEKNKDKERVTIQLLSDRDVIVTLHFDDVCEYAGNVDQLMDF